ncbi:MAG: indole-3-glycerol phosphate synthase TrpC [Deltaproteobacteria bacterium]|nr:indole-3-glycerol phosphate synthase TrpC [Deltaproteobacteria bacterium]MBW1953745.1 indole-3-glycerol phosphate synthase TrpC [Deltaproteobacteria bacterium]MBW1987495.1 indole-3-glycerol phosphate synthase TrpC [Deltaproteobacteria bacterium]MBW2135614.1 indole-3-glycerol phosphate synthase TrpC [Deltaproteobacteria bacterium]
MNFLQRIAARKLAETEELFAAGRLEDFRHLIAHRSAPMSLKSALDQSPVPAIIAEIKKASPSKGVLAAAIDPVALAHTYQAHGAAALSVLTERAFFQGSPEMLAELRLEVNLPILRKDFILEPIQVYESAALGADALLLIVALLPLGILRALLLLTRSLGLEALVEVHTKAELDQALEAGARLIGINHRNLRTFEVNMERALELAPLIPPEITVVAASGLKSRNDFKRLEAVGIRAFLIGEALVTASDPGAKLKEFMEK